MKKPKTTDYHNFTTKDMPVAERRKFDVGDIWMNSAQCAKCEDIITSNNRHDFKHCKCGAIFVDGGSWYARRGAEDLNDIIDKCVMFDNTDDHIDK